MSGPTPASPRPAATVLLLRGAAAGGIEVLLQRRAEGMGFMAGAFVFPGGRLDPADGVPEILARCDLSPPEAARRLDLLDAPEVALGLHVAALRELFEEAGVLLAEGVSGPDPTAAPLPDLRRALHSRKLGFLDVLHAQRLTLHTSAIWPIARWITPEIEPRRFDARFFIATAPRDALPSHDELESVESRWLRPEEAVELGRSGEILLPPPTTKSLELLSGFASPEAVFEWARERTPVTICPEAQLLDGMVVILLPGDPQSSQPQAVYPGPTRYTLSGGAWLPG